MCSCFGFNCFRLSRVFCGRDDMVIEDSSVKFIVVNGKFFNDDVFFVVNFLFFKFEISIDVTFDLVS